MLGCLLYVVVVELEFWKLATENVENVPTLFFPFCRGLLIMLQYLVNEVDHSQISLIGTMALNTFQFLSGLDYFPEQH